MVPAEWSSAHPRLLAKIDHECSVKPVRNEKYLKILQQRQLESSQTKRCAAPSFTSYAYEIKLKTLHTDKSSNLRTPG